MMSYKKYLFKSERLGFRNWIEEDAPKMVAISADPVVMEYFPSVATPDQTIGFIKRMQSMQAEKGYCYFAIDELETGEFIGFIGLCDQDFDVEFCPCTDIGWRLDSKYWNRGYATEGATACLDYAFETIGLKEVFSTAPVINTASINIMLKMGMEKYLNYVHPKLIDNERLKNCVCYKITNS
ncbi:MAG: RimJ/RimL family protein N-acetyltransferase [Crocinitomicaceae bacterium]|jgi:RimJ/RimL family protein N-acetyltransferase